MSSQIPAASDDSLNHSKLTRDNSSESSHNNNNNSSINNNNSSINNNSSSNRQDMERGGRTTDKRISERENKDQGGPAPNKWTKLGMQCAAMATLEEKLQEVAVSKMVDGFGFLLDVSMRNSLETQVWGTVEAVQACLSCSRRTPEIAGLGHGDAPTACLTHR